MYLGRWVSWKAQIAAGHFKIKNESRLCSENVRSLKSKQGWKRKFKLLSCISYETNIGSWKLDNMFKGAFHILFMLNEQTNKPWSSGYGWQLMFERLWVRILTPDTGWTFFTLICGKNCNVCLKRPKINKKRWGWPIYNNNSDSSLHILQITLFCSLEIETKFEV